MAVCRFGEYFPRDFSNASIQKYHQSEFMAGFAPFHDVEEPFYHPLFDGRLPRRA
jgi:hypothetical protein